MTNRIRSLALAIGAGVLLIAAGCATMTRVPRAPTTASLTVVSYNVNYGLPGDKVGLNAMTDADSDVILLQEVTEGWRKGLESLRGRYPHQRFHFRSDAGGLAVLSRHPISHAEIMENPVSWFPAQLVVVESPIGPVQMVNVHLRPPFTDSGNMLLGYFTTPEIREAEMETFLSGLRTDVPAVVAGDFNEDSGPACSLLFQAGFGSALEDYAPNVSTWRWPLGIVEAHNRLDHVFFSRGLDATDAWVVDKGRSDHFPVVAVLERKEIGRIQHRTTTGTISSPGSISSAR